MKSSNKNWFSLICIVLGVTIVVVSVALLLHNRFAADTMAKKAQRVLGRVWELIPEPIDRVPEERGENRMPTLQVDGLNITAVMEFPKYARELPVMAGWDPDVVSAVPCRFTGSIYDRSMIIGAGDGQGQVNFASQLEVGDKIVLTDMEGGRYTYKIEAIHHAAHATLEKLQSGDYGLTVFLKDSKTGDYLLIRCNTAM